MAAAVAKHTASRGRQCKGSGDSVAQQRMWAMGPMTVQLTVAAGCEHVVAGHCTAVPCTFVGLMFIVNPLHAQDHGLAHRAAARPIRELQAVFVSKAES